MTDARHMTPDEFRRCGTALIERIARYMEEVERYPVLSQAEPGSVRARLPRAAPEQGEPFAHMLRDIDEIVLPGLTHWQSPNFFAYFPANASGRRSSAIFSLRAWGSRECCGRRVLPAPSSRPMCSTGWSIFSGCRRGSRRPRPAAESSRTARPAARLRRCSPPASARAPARSTSTASGAARTVRRHRG